LRFRVVPAGRRSGKTELAKRFLVKTALKPAIGYPSNFFCAAPTRFQAREIFWNDLKNLIPPNNIKGVPSESLLCIQLHNGSSIYVLGMDRPERIEGRPWDGGILDEYGNMKKETWHEHVRPAMYTEGRHPGWVWFIGVPEGRNHYFELWEHAVSGEEPGVWQGFHWKSADILPMHEIEQAKRDLDELTFRQEYEGDFITFQGRVYYVFDKVVHAKQALKYDASKPLVLCFDFNISPGTCAIIQEQMLPSGYVGTGVIDEVWIPTGSNTLLVCDRILQKYSGHKGTVTAYGDPTGQAGGTAKIRGTDWDLIEEKFRPVFGGRFKIKLRRAHPRVRDMINTINSRLLSVSGEVKLMVDPVNASHVVADFEGVRLMKDGSGKPDKQADPMLTHLSDGIGYYTELEFPLRKTKTVVQEII